MADWIALIRTMFCPFMQERAKGVCMCVSQLFDWRTQHSYRVHAQLRIDRPGLAAAFLWTPGLCRLLVARDKSPYEPCEGPDYVICLCAPLAQFRHSDID